MIPDTMQPKEARRFRVKKRTMLKAAAACMLLPLSACQASSSQPDNTTYSAGSFASEFSRLPNGNYTLNGINSDNLHTIPHSKQITVSGRQYAENELTGFNGYIIVLISLSKERVIFNHLADGEQVTIEGEKTDKTPIGVSFVTTSSQPS